MFDCKIRPLNLETKYNKKRKKSMIPHNKCLQVHNIKCNNKKIKNNKMCECKPKVCYNTNGGDNYEQIGWI